MPGQINSNTPNTCARSSRHRLATGLALAAALLLAACGGSSSANTAGEATTEDPAPVDGTTPGPTPDLPAWTTSTTADETTTGLLAGSTGEASLWPWHAPGSAHGDPADAVTEFADYFGFDPLVVLGEFQQADARSGEIEILPPFRGVPFVLPFPEGSDAADYYEPGEDGFGEWWAGPTTALVRLDDDDNWVVAGAASPGLVVDSPTPNTAVSSEFEVHFRNEAMTWRLELQMWPDGAAVAAVDRDVTGGTGLFSVGEEVFEPVEWAADVAGPATLVVTSGDPVFAVTTVRLELDPTSLGPTDFTDPVGDLRGGILYQPDLRLSVYGADDCADGPRPAIVTSRGFADYRDELNDLGYVVVEAQLRTSGGGVLRGIGFKASDLGVAVKWVRAHADELCIDSDRIAAAGHSISTFAALAFAYSVDELEPGDTITIPELDGSIELGDYAVPSAPPPEFAAYSDEIAAVVAFSGFAYAEHIDAGEPPALLINGRNNKFVPFALAEQTCAAATAVGVRCELLPHDGGLEHPSDTLATVTAIDEFLRQVLEVATAAGS